MPTNEFTDSAIKAARRRVPRSRGATSGFLLLLLGLWGALIPLLGPIVHFGFAPDKTFKFTVSRFWLEILPGAVVVVGALLLLGLASRVVTSLGAWLAVAGGAWFIVGNNLQTLLHLGTLGKALQKTKLGVALDSLLLLDGLGALILFLGALALGRLGVVSVRDVRAANRRAQGDNDSSNDTSHEDTSHNDDDARTARRNIREPAVDEPVVVRRDEPATVRTTTETVAEDSHRSHGIGGGATSVNRENDQDR